MDEALPVTVCASVSWLVTFALGIGARRPCSGDRCAGE